MTGDPYRTIWELITHAEITPAGITYAIFIFAGVMLVALLAAELICSLFD